MAATATATFKLIVLGDAGAGKTSILKRASHLRFGTENVTVGVSVHSKTVSTRDGLVHLELWDTAGQEKFCSRMTPMYLRNARIVLFVYDSSDQTSSDHLVHWYQEHVAEIIPGAVLVVVAAKKDKSTDSAVVPPAFVESDHLPLMECSALNGAGVEELMQYAAEEAITRRNAGNLALNGGAAPAVNMSPSSNDSVCYC
jgi:small GTP-binding protein